MRETIRPSLDSGMRNIDKHIVLLLSHTGPKFVNKAAVCMSSTVRRVGHTYYDKGFAEIFLRESLLCHGRMRPVRSRLLGEFTRMGNLAANMLPVNVRGWMALLEDVMASPMVKSLFDELVDQCLTHDEFRHVSSDATLRCAMSIRGQASYRASKATRADAPIDDTRALRRVLTIRGRTGAPLCMTPVRGEAADDVTACMKAHVKAAALRQITWIASDQPSGHYYEALKEVCPNLECLFLDPVHLVIVYDQAFWRKRTPGQTLLRRIQAKFNGVDYNMSADVWGPMYNGRELVRLSREQDHTYPQKSDKHRQHGLRGTTPLVYSCCVLTPLLFHLGTLVQTYAV